MRVKAYANKERSLELSQKNRTFIEKKMCYNNVFNIFSRDAEVRTKVSQGAWMVAYGYVQSLDDLFIRHAYFVDTQTNEVIDPTLALLDMFKEKEEILYFHLQLFQSEMYLSVLTENNAEPSLTRFLMKKDLKLQQQLMEEGVLCSG